MKIHGRKALIFVLLLAAMALSACGPTDGEQVTQAPGAVQNTPAVEAPEATENPVETEAVPGAGEGTAEDPAVTAAPAGETEAAETEAAETEPAATEAATEVVAEAAASVTSFPDPAGFAWVPVLEGLNRPLDLADPSDGTNRLLVVEKPGRILVLQDGSLLAEPFLDIRDRVGIDGNERGLLGLALHPDYLENGFFYLNYTNKDGDTVIARFSVTGDLNRADPGSEKQLLTYDQPYPNHNGGVVAFGPDGYLYIGSGDGGSRNDPENNAQSLDSLLGKILRIDVDGGDPYAIPADNPFANGGGRPEIWAYGLRNPWRFSFDRVTGDLYIGDVGQNAIEEIDFEPADAAGGLNYGWKFKEGTRDDNGGPPPNFNSVAPVTEYEHSNGCSVTGGFIYRGEDLPEFYGVYLYADYCSGKMWGLLRGADGSWQTQELFQLGGTNITSFGQDSRGELYITDDNGRLLKLQRN